MARLGCLGVRRAYCRADVWFDARVVLLDLPLSLVNVGDLFEIQSGVAFHQVEHRLYAVRVSEDLPSQGSGATAVSKESTYVATGRTTAGPDAIHLTFMFFNDWFGLLRVIVVGTLAYAALVFMLRVSGNRTLTKMNAFDLVVTIAIGSTLATVLLSKDVVLAEGLVALALLIALQWIVAFLSVRSAKWRELVKSEPRILALRGEFLLGAMIAERFTEGEVNAAVRAHGISSLQEVEAVVVETDGSLSVIAAPKGENNRSALRVVNGFPSDS